MELIDREALGVDRCISGIVIPRIYAAGWNDLLSLVQNAPTIDAAPVAHGRWEICADGYYPYCSACREEPKSGRMSNYCPACGARMDGGETS